VTNAAAAAVTSAGARPAAAAAAAAAAVAEAAAVAKEAAAVAEAAAAVAEEAAAVVEAAGVRKVAAVWKGGEGANSVTRRATRAVKVTEGKRRRGKARESTRRAMRAAKAREGAVLAAAPSLRTQGTGCRVQGVALPLRVRRRRIEPSHHSHARSGVRLPDLNPNPSPNPNP